MFTLLHRSQVSASTLVLVLLPLHSLAALSRLSCRSDACLKRLSRRVDLLPFAGNERRLLIRPGRCLWHEFCRARRGAFEWAKVECGAGAGPRSPPSATKALTPYFEFLIMTARKSFGGACTPPPPPCRLVPSVLDPPPPRPGDRHFSFELFLVI